MGSSAIKIGSPVPVYDLTVADGHLPEFYADGVLVHNCTWTPTDSGYSPDRLDAVVHGLAAALFPQALIKGGVPGASGHASPVGQRIDGSRMSAQPRRPGGGLRVDTGGRGRPATVPGLPSRSSFGAAGRRLIVPGRTR